jgi:DNA-directed RNA polymerase subunit alpha
LKEKAKINDFSQTKQNRRNIIMVRDKVTIDTKKLQWKCVESRKDGNRLYYGRFALAPFLKGQAYTIGSAIRRVLLGEIEGTCITRAKFGKIPHEFSTIFGIQESVYEILMNLKEIVLKSNFYGTQYAYIYLKGPREVTAQDILLPYSVEIIDNTQHIASLTEPIDLFIELQIERDRGYRHRQQLTKNFQDGSYPIDAIFMPVRNANYSVHSCRNENEEILFLEIWTNGSLTPKEALREASRNLIELFMSFLEAEEEENIQEEEEYFQEEEENIQEEEENIQEEEENFQEEEEYFQEEEEYFQEEEEYLQEEEEYLQEEEENIQEEEENIQEEEENIQEEEENIQEEEENIQEEEENIQEKIPPHILLKEVFIDQVEFSPRIYNYLKKCNIDTLWDLVNMSEEDLLKMEYEDSLSIVSLLERVSTFW